MIRHTTDCRNKWSMEIQICTCGAGAAIRELAMKDAEIARLRATLELVEGWDNGIDATES